MNDLKITLIQTDLFWENKAANLQMLEQKINSISQATHVVVLPEMFSTGFSMKPELFAEKMDGKTVAWMKEMAATKKIILTGSIIIAHNGRYYNRLVWMLPNGGYGYYDKRHLFAFGAEDKHYAAGEKRLIVSVNGWKINLQVCYDLRFPVWARQQALPPHSRGLAGRALEETVSEAHEKTDGEAEYDVLLYVANWPERRIHAWKTLLMARAIENQCYAIGVNRVGKDGNDIYHSGASMVAGPMGEMLYQKEHDADIFTIHLSKEHLIATREKFPFSKDADDFILV